MDNANEPNSAFEIREGPKNMKIAAMTSPYLYLGVAILSEVIATTALNLSRGFSKPFPVLVVIIGYLLSFYLVSLALIELPVGLVYATWAGLGIISIAIIGTVFFGEQVDIAASLVSDSFL